MEEVNSSTCTVVHSAQGVLKPYSLKCSIQGMSLLCNPVISADFHFSLLKSELEI